jgi:hypothetical protein
MTMRQGTAFRLRKALAAAAYLLAGVIGLGLSLALAQDTAIHLRWLPGQDDAEAPQGWKALTFKTIPRHTRYTLVTDDETTVLKAQADRSASGLIHRVDADPRKLAVLRWRWKVENVIRHGDVTHKEGDDYPARIYVTFAYDPKRASLVQRIKYEAARLIYGEYPPHAGLNYIWDTRSPAGTMVPNPFTDRVRMIVVESGSARLGQWVEYERNVYEDYRRAFGEEPPRISGLAVMTDGDNTGETATAYYGDIVLRAAER